MTQEETKHKKRKVTDGELIEEEKKKDRKKHKHDHKHKKEKKDKRAKSKKDDQLANSGAKDTGDAPATVTSYTQSKELTELPQSTIDNYMQEHEITIEDPLNLNLRPLLSFSQVNLIDEIQEELSKFPNPTAIQAAAWPYLLSGKDVVGVAETGSGKTLAFGVPAVNNLVLHNTGHSERKLNKGIRVLVISPTRELASQIYDNLVSLTDRVGLKCCCLYGGVPKEAQRKSLKHAAIVVATPGRLLDLVQEGAADLSKVKYLVLDEADRMLEKGFEDDIKKIIGQTASNQGVNGRQTLMFTATWPKEVRELAHSFMRDPVKVSIGNRDELTANKRITQIVEVIDPMKKEKRLVELLRQYQSGAKRNDKVLIFVLYKKEAARVERNLRYNGFKLSAIHGDLSQQQRTQALNEFKDGKVNILLATDVAARGLDIPNVKTVINATFPLTIEDYVHRIGRTGRAGQTGTAHTLFTEHEKHLAGALVNVLKSANQEVPESLLKFGTHTKKKEHSAYGAFYKDVDMSKKPKKITFD